MTTFLLVFGAFVAAAISGVTGFGGALLLLPLLIHVVGVEQAVPLLTLAQAVGNVSRAVLGWSVIDWASVGWFCAGAVPGAVLGASVFVTGPLEVITRAIGLALIAFGALKLLGFEWPRLGRAAFVTAGAVVGALSGVVGSAGPLGAAAFLTLGLSPVAYVASEAVTAIAMHGVKLVVYQSSLGLDRAFWGLAMVLSAAMVLGTLVANRWLRGVRLRTFQRVVAGLMVAIGGWMAVAGG